MVELSAAERLELGDRVRERVCRGESVAEIARRDGRSAEHVRKSIWLSVSYGKSVRREIGRARLARLGPSHLETVAIMEPDLRTAILRRAADEGLSVRELKELGKGRGVDAEERYGTAGDLTRARKAMKTYAGWSSDDLERLLAGPNGRVIRELAECGMALRNRLNTVKPGRLKK